VAWQVVPTALQKLLASDDEAAAGRATEAMMRMKKMDIAELERAFKG
jgi:predicted 3-demethylubiquinone-9 3-methyltransferase (glyoxalase superfamily)